MTEEGGVSERVPLAHNAVVSSTAGLWRTELNGEPAVLKVLHCGTEGLARWLASPDIDHPRYWKREALAYRSGLLDALDALDGVRAPRLLDFVERRDGSIELWLEDLAASGTAATEWTIERLATAARHLGRMQGAAAGAIPDEPWLSRGWLREYVEDRTDLMAGKLDIIEPSLASTWVDRHQFLDWIDRLPKTVCHLDVWPPNLFDVDGETVLIDWAFVGIGALGEDPGNLVPDAVLDLYFPSAQVDDIDRRVTEEYLTGLSDRGWSGDERLVRLGMVASATVKYTWMAARLLDADLDPHVRAERVLAVDMLARWADEARRLARKVFGT